MADYQLKNGIFLNESSGFDYQLWGLQISESLVIGGPIFSRPASDVSAPGWTSTAGTLAGAINEVTRSDASFITSPDIASTPDPARFLFDAPLPAGTHDLSFSAQHTNLAGEVRVVFLDAGGTPVGASTWAATTLVWAAIDVSVTTTGAAAGAQIEVRPAP